MIWNYALNFCLIVPVNVIFALAVDVGATFWLFTVVVWLTMPLVAFLIATLFVIPYIKFMEFISNKYWLIFILLSVLLIVAFVLYSLLLGLVQSLLETGSIKHLFNEAFVTTLQTMLNVYPINAFANIIFGQNLFVSLTLAVALAGLSVLVVYTISKHLYYATLYKNEIVSQPFQKSRNYNQLNPLISLIKKEFVTVFRNPNQLFSYFAIATAMPFMVYSCYTLFESLIENALGLSLTFPLALLILLVFSILTNTFCATNVSRDGLTALKSKVFPVKAKTLLLAKVLFCAIVSSLSVLASTILLGFATSLSWTDALIATFVGLVFSTAQIFVATKMDLKHCNVSATPAEMEAVSNRTITKVVFVGLILALVIGLSAVIINILSNSSFQLFILQPIFAYVIPLVGSVVYLTVAVVYYTFKIEKRFATLVM